jgi:hypothetical protein
MTSNTARAVKLFEAFDLLDRAHALVQEAVGDTNNTTNMRGSSWKRCLRVITTTYLRCK